MWPSAAKWHVTRDRFPSCSWFLRPWPLLNVDQVVYYDADGDATTLATTDYEVDTVAQPGRVVPAYGLGWPATRAQKPNAATADTYAGCAVPITAVNTTTNVLTVGVFVPANGDQVWLTTDGTTPTGLSTDTGYFVVGRDASAKTIQLALTSGGAAIDITGAGSGQHWLHPSGDTTLWFQARRAVLLLAAHWWEHREDQVDGGKLTSITTGLERLIASLHPGDDFQRSED